MSFKVRESNGKLEIYENDELISIYNYSNELLKPFFYPLNAPGGLCITEDKPKDHPHHRSMWTSHGDINGEDFWSETQKSGKQVVKSVNYSITEDSCTINSQEVWISNSNNPVVDVFRKITFYKSSKDSRAIDVEVTFKATYETITFGDTKEGGILSFRVHPSMREDKGGIIKNSEGGIGEPQCWGKRAKWCDYTGVINNTKVGITIFDHPSNFRHPTYWHVRAYGLFTANCFGISFFEGNKSLSGAYTLEKGKDLKFKYRALIHLGELGNDKLNNIFNEFSGR